MDGFIRTHLDEVIVVKSIVTMHYFEFARDYVFNGERHNFWEFLYVDKGEVEIMADTNGYKLEQGDVVFHKPNEFHSVWANGVIAPNIVVISFECDSEEMKFFNQKILRLSAEERNLIGQIIKEGRDTFSNMMNHSYELEKNENRQFGSDQLIKVYLELFLITLVRKNGITSNKERLSSATKERMEEDIVNNIIQFLKKNVRENFSFDDICYTFSVGKTHLKTIFKRKTGMGVMSFFKNLKIEESKKMIREGKYNITEIANILSYDSVHYFSRVFKKYTNMSPSEYANSVKARGLI